MAFKIEITLLDEPGPKLWAREDVGRPWRPPEMTSRQFRNAFACWRQRAFRLLRSNCMAAITRHMGRSRSESDALIAELADIVAIETERLELAWMFRPVVTLTPDGVDLAIVLVGPR